MRLILIVALLLPMNCRAVEPDKRAHMETSAFIALPSMLACHAMEFKRPWLCALGFTLTLGLLKEISDPVFDEQDMTANAIGVTSVLFPFMIYEF